MNTKRRIPAHACHIVIATLISIFLVACHSQSSPQEYQSTAEEQRKHEEAHKDTMKKLDTLTSGYDKSMQYVPPSAGYDPKKAQRAKQPVSPTQSQSRPQSKEGRP